MPGNDLIQSLARGLDLLRLLAESEGGLRIADLVTATGLKRPTVHNLLRTLASRDFVVKDGATHRVGPAVYMLVADDASSSFLARAEEATRLLAKRLPEAIVSFCEPVGGEVVVRFRQFPDRMLLERNSGAVLAPHQTASGLAFLAYADPETRHSVQLRHPFQVAGTANWGSEEELETYLAEIRRTGVVFPPFARASKYRVAGCPCLNATGKFLGVLGAAWHTTPQMTDAYTDEILAVLVEAARDLMA
ncbi:MAG: helix-turn-helix domain-containing protein [Victivallales bacterium]|nr:helix-turn-helix domain-containing protein [Victivallales bacterium]